MHIPSKYMYLCVCNTALQLHSEFNCTITLLGKCIAYKISTFSQFHVYFLGSTYTSRLHTCIIAEHISARL